MRLRLDANSSGSLYARGLLKALFTKELEGRSLFGRPSNAHKGFPQKEPLDSKKINAILGMFVTNILSVSVIFFAVLNTFFMAISVLC